MEQSANNYQTSGWIPLFLRPKLMFVKYAVVTDFPGGSATMTSFSRPQLSSPRSGLPVILVAGVLS